MSIGSLLSKLVTAVSKNETIKTAVLAAALKLAAAGIDKGGAKLKIPVELTTVAKAALAEEALKGAVARL